MIGDVNFFLYPFSDDNDEADHPDSHSDFVGEVDVMVAEKGHRGQGVGFGAVTALMVYVYRNLDAILEEHQKGADGSYGKGDGGHDQSPGRLRGLMVKIQQDNEKSIALFKRAGFRQKGEVNYFGEIEMVLDDFVPLMSASNAETDGLSWRPEVEKTYKEMKYIRQSSNYQP